MLIHDHSLLIKQQRIVVVSQDFSKAHPHILFSKAHPHRPKNSIYYHQISVKTAKYT